MKLLLMSHGNMAIETLASARMIVGDVANTAAIGLQPNQGPEDLQKAAEDFINDNPNDEKIIVAVDLLGGTPSNVVVKLIAEYPELEVVSGLNLPMVLSYANQVMMGMEVEKQTLISEAQNGIIDVNKRLNE